MTHFGTSSTRDSANFERSAAKPHGRARTDTQTGTESMNDSADGPDPSPPAGSNEPSASTPSELSVEALLRAGKVPAEIAARLGISIGAVIEVANKLKAEDEQPALTEDVAALATVRTRRLAPLLRGSIIVGVLLALALGVIVWLSPASGGGAHSNAATANGTVAGGVRHPSPVSGASLGSLVSAPGGASRAILTASVREALTVVTLASGAELSPPALPGWSIENATTGQALSLLGQSGARWVLLTLAPSSGTQVHALGDGRFAVLGAAPQLLITATAVQDGAPIQVDVDPRTGAFSLRDNGAANAVLDARTGARIDIAHASPAGFLTGASTEFTTCDPARAAPGPRCEVVWTGSNPMPAPADGVACFAGQGIEVFKTAAATLVIQDAGQPSIPPACAPGTSQQIARGDPIAGRGSYFIFSWPGGDTLESAVVARDGSLFAGDVEASASCPCQPTPDPFQTP